MKIQCDEPPSLRGFDVHHGQFTASDSGHDVNLELPALHPRFTRIHHFTSESASRPVETAAFGQSGMRSERGTASLAPERR